MVKTSLKSLPYPERIEMLEYLLASGRITLHQYAEFKRRHIMSATFPIDPAPALHLANLIADVEQNQ